MHVQVFLGSLRQGTNLVLIVNTMKLRIFMLFILFVSIYSKAEVCTQSVRAVRKLQDIQTLKILTLNMQEFVRRTKKAVAPKSPWAIDGISKMILDSNPDIIIAQEVDEAALKRMNKLKLGGRFSVRVLVGNDPYGKQVGFLIREDLPFTLSMETHREYKMAETNQRVFSRDLPAAIFRTAPEKDPFLIVLGTHLKAGKLFDPDPNSDRLRKLQIEATLRIAQEYKRKFPGAVIVEGGDKNTDLISSEVAERFSGFFTDLFDVVGVTSRADRGTFHYRSANGKPVSEQIDSLLISHGSESKVLSVKKISPPITRDGPATDHSGVWAEISTSGMY